MTIIYDKRGWPYLNCPEGHCMGWLGSCFWICSACRPRVIYVSRMAGRLRAASR